MNHILNAKVHLKIRNGNVNIYGYIGRFVSDAIIFDCTLGRCNGICDVSLVMLPYWTVPWVVATVYGTFR